MCRVLAVDERERRGQEMGNSFYRILPGVGMIEKSLFGEIHNAGYGTLVQPLAYL